MMKIILSKEELLDACSKCTESAANGCCDETCPFGEECKGAYIDFWRDNTEVINDD